MESKKTVILADYISYTDKQGEPVGHPLKVLKEYAELISDEYVVRYAAYWTYLTYLEQENHISLPGNIAEGEDYVSIKGKLKQLLISWKNITYIFRQGRKDFVWFCNIDLFLLIYLAFHPWKCKRVILTTYLKEFSSGYQNQLFQYAMKHVGLFLCSNKENTYCGSNHVFIPDYLYDANIYRKYVVNDKQEKVVCLGTMGEQKELRELVGAFVKSGYPLEIIGHFSNKELFRELSELAGHNIKVRDTYLEYEEYLTILGEAKFSVLPYRRDAYEAKTSGVLLESVFLQTIPITNQRLLQNWEVHGVGYGDVRELSTVNLYKYDTDDLNNMNEHLIAESYNKEKYRKILLSRLKEMDC